MSSPQERIFTTIGKTHPEEPEDFGLHLEGGEVIVFRGKSGALLDMLPLKPKVSTDYYPTRVELAEGVYGGGSPANVRRVVSLVGALRMDLDPLGWYIFYEKPKNGDQKGYYLADFYRDDDSVPTTLENQGVQETKPEEQPILPPSRILTRQQKINWTSRVRSAHDFLEEYSRLEDRILGGTSLQSPGTVAGGLPQASNAYRHHSRRYKGIADDNLSTPETYFKQKEK